MPTQDDTTSVTSSYNEHDDQTLEMSVKDEALDYSATSLLADVTCEQSHDGPYGAWGEIFRSRDHFVDMHIC